METQIHNHFILMLSKILRVYILDSEKHLAALMGFESMHDHRAIRLVFCQLSY